MASLPLAVVLLLAFTGSSGASWCVCKDGNVAGMQKALDYACGAGADCNPIKTTGPCFQPNTVRAHCNYAVNSYFQKKGQTPLSCDFAGAATVSASDPSTAGCSYPASASAVSTGTGTGTGTGTTTPSIGTGTTSPTTSSSSTSPFSSTPGVLGGIGSGMGPSGVGTNSDESHGGLRLAADTSLFLPSLFSGLIMMLVWWG